MGVIHQVLLDERVETWHNQGCGGTTETPSPVFLSCGCGRVLRGSKSRQSKAVLPISVLIALKCQKPAQSTGICTKQLVEEVSVTCKTSHGARGKRIEIMEALFFQQVVDERSKSKGANCSLG